MAPPLSRRLWWGQAWAACHAPAYTPVTHIPPWTRPSRPPRSSARRRSSRWGRSWAALSRVELDIACHSCWRGWGPRLRAPPPPSERLPPTSLPLPLQHPATRATAEATLLAFRASPAALDASRAVLEAPTATPGARFHAALALREAFLRDWDAIGRNGHAALRSYLQARLLATAGEEGGPAARAARGALAAALAAAVKRGWCDMDDGYRAAALSGLEAAATGAQGAPAAASALAALSAVVSEFAPATASPLGKPWEWHDACRASLQEGWLPRLWSVAAAAAASPSSAPGALDLASTVLAWDWAPPHAPAGGYGGGRPACGDGAAKPGVALRAALAAPGGVDWAFSAAAAVDPTSDVATAARQLVVLLAGIDWGGDPVGPRAASAAFACSLAWASPPPAAIAAADAGRDGGALIDACRALAALAAASGAAGLDAAGAGAGLASLAELSVACLDAGSGDGGGAAADEAGDVLLDAWTCLCAGVGGSPPTTLSSLPPAAGRVFAAHLRAGLAAAAAGAAESEDEGEAAAVAAGCDADGERLARAAALARAAPEASVSLLTEAVTGARAAAEAAARAGGDPGPPLEQLVFSLRAAAAALADAGAGETPAVPDSMAGLSHAAAAAGAPCPVAALSSALVAAVAAGAAGPAYASPRLMEAAAWGAARWAGTYVCPDGPLPPPLDAAFGARGGGPAVAASLAGAAASFLTAWPGETDLHSVAAGLLLPALVRSRAGAAATLAAPAAAALADAVASPDDRLAGLAEPVQRSLATALARASAGAPDAATARAHVARLAAGPAARLATLAAAPPRGDVGAAVARAVEAMRGLVRGAPPRAQPALATAFGGAAPALATLAASFRADRRVSCLLLKLAADAVDALVAHLPPADAAALARWALSAARDHAAARAGEASVAASARLRAEDEADAERELRALLRLAAALTARGVADWSGGAAGDDVDVGGSLLDALECVLPLATPAMLSYPRLAASLYALVGDVVETYPERIPRLPPGPGGRLLAALDAGAARPEEACAVPCLAAVASMATWAAADAAAGGAGGAALAGELGSRYARPLLARLLVGDAPRGVADAVADALLPLARAAPAAWRAAVADLLASCGGAAPRVAAALACLDAAAAPAPLAGGAGPAAARVARRKFRAAVSRFVADARGAVRTC